MNVLFVYSLDDIQSPAKPLRSPEQIQFGVSYISAVLKAGGHRTSLVVTGRALGRNRHKALDRRLAEFEPGLVCFSAISTEYDVIVDAARHVQARRPDAFLVAGGTHISLNADEDMLKIFDAICIGEGEQPVLELAEKLAGGGGPSRIQNLWIRRGDTVEKNPTRPFLQDLDALPLPDRDLWTEWTAEQPDARHMVLLGRGCPFQCTYCSNHALKKLASGPYVRFRSPENILAEVRQLAQTHPDKHEIYLEVESFTVKPDWAIELCDALARFNVERTEPLSFGVNVRVTPNVDFDALFAAARRANFRFINVGLESGSQRVRREVLNRNYSNDDVLAAVQAARKHGLKICFFNIVGLPGETEADFQETVRMNRLCAPDWHFTSIFYPYPGTELCRQCQALGLLPKTLDPRMERSRALLDLPGMPRRRIQHHYTWFDYYVSRGRKPLWRILARALLNKCMAMPGLFRLYRRLTQLSFFSRLKSAAKPS